MNTTQRAVDDILEAKLFAWFATLAICVAVELLFLFGVSQLTGSVWSALGWSFMLGAPLTVFIWPSVYARVYSAKPQSTLV